MKTRRTLPLLCVTILTIATAGVAQQSPETSPTSPAASELAKVLAKYRRASQPGGDHRWLAPLEGQWKLEIGWNGPDGTSRKVVGAAEHRWILGGRFLLCEATTTEAEVPIEALLFYGFDSTRNRFFSLMLDDLRTNYLELQGTYDVVSRSFVLSGKERDEVSGQQITYRMRLHVPEPDRHTVELFVDYPGRGPQKILDAVYTRR